MTKHNLRSVRGVKDVFDKEITKFDQIINTSSNIAKLYTYKKIITPIIEYAEIFDRSLGQESDIISKEMYSFRDRSNELLVLRPEFTASIIRAYITNGWKKYNKLKLYSYGPVFRYDRPQTGRQREFNQINFESIGNDHPLDDAEMISIAHHLLEKLGIKNKALLEINSLGCNDSRETYLNDLRKYFDQYKNSLSLDSQKKIDSNPLRILDSKNIQDKEICYTAPKIDAYYTKQSKEYFDKVQEYLHIFNIQYNVNTNLVRGLDYYSHTIFEFIYDLDKSQNTIIAGGRYNNLSKMLGADEISGVGFAGGIERLALLTECIEPKKEIIVVLCLEEQYLTYAIQVVKTLRMHNKPCTIMISNKIIKSIKKAENLEAKYIAFIGDEEKNKSIITLKHLGLKKEYKVPLEEAYKYCV